MDISTASPEAHSVDDEDVDFEICQDSEAGSRGLSDDLAGAFEQYGTDSSISTNDEIHGRGDLIAMFAAAFVVSLVCGVVAYIASGLLGYIVIRSNRPTTYFAGCVAILTIIAVTYLMSRTSLRQYRSTKQAEASMAARAMEEKKLLESRNQNTYVSNLTDFLDEEWIEVLVGKLYLTFDEDIGQLAYLIATDQSLVISILDSDPVLQDEKMLPRYWHRIAFDTDNTNAFDERPFWKDERDGGRIIIPSSSDRLGIFSAAEPSAVDRLLGAAQASLKIARRAAGLPELPSLGRGSRPDKRLVRDAHEAEEVVATWVQWLGWSDAYRTPASNDNGYDVIGHGSNGTVVAQVKFEAKPAGRPILQALYGAGHGEAAEHWLFFTSAGYSPPALEWADKVGMALFRFSLDGDIEAVNWCAFELMEA